ncbi:MAG TPA: hypothetical protein VGR28_05310 [Candidatus Thermoplasmatota archaeon]|jgi:hypothetical protein|nr:hypothetical protein [Candidatus Thermoplasmatota archaeon]
MKTHASLLVAGALALVAVIAPAAAVTVSTTGTTYDLVAETLDGGVGVRSADGPPSADGETLTCSAIAPVETFCTTGTHTIPAGRRVTHQPLLVCPIAEGVSLPTTCYFGRVTSVLSDGVNTRTFFCDIIGPYQVPFAGIQCPVGTGTYPTGTFTQTCFATPYGNAYPTEVGVWGCELIYL